MTYVRSVPVTCKFSANTHPACAMCVPHHTVPLEAPQLAYMPHPRGELCDAKNLALLMQAFRTQKS